MPTLADALDNLIFQNLESLKQETEELRAILEPFISYWYSKPSETKATVLIRKLKIAFTMLEVCLANVQDPPSGNQDYQTIATKLKLIYYLRSFYMMNHVKVLVLPRKDPGSYKEPRQRWITITNEWQKYQKLWTQIRSRESKEIKDGCEAIIRICSQSLEGLV